MNELPWRSRLLSGPRPFVALALLQVAIALLVWSPFPAGVWHDDGVYLLLGRALAEGEGLRYHGVAGAYPAPKFPPVYPWTLGALSSVLPDMGSVTLWAGILNLGFVASSCLVFFHVLRILGLAPGSAAGLAALGWAPVVLWRSALVPFSEPLFLLLLCGALALACRLERKMAGAVEASDRGSDHRPRHRVLWLGTILLLLAGIHVRTVGVALAGAVGVALWSRAGKGIALATLGAVAGGMLPWMVWSSRANAGIPDTLRDVLGSYGAWLLEQVVSYPRAYLAGLHGGAVDLLDRFLSLLLPVPPSWEVWVDDFRILALLFFVPAFFLGLDRIWPRSRTLILFLFFYLGIVWVWPFQATRLLVPLVPVLVLVLAAGFFGVPAVGGEQEEEGGGQAAEGRRAGMGSRPFPQTFVRGWRGVGVAWVVALAGVSAWNLGNGWAGSGFRINSGALARTVQAVEDATPAGAVVGAPEFWAAIPLHSDRTGAPSARFLPVRPPDAGPSWGNPAEQHRIWALTGIEYLVLEQRGMIHGDAVDAVAEACGAGSVPGVASWPEGRLVRLDWDADCRSRLGLPLDLAFQGGVDLPVGPAAQE